MQACPPADDTPTLLDGVEYTKGNTCTVHYESLRGRATAKVGYGVGHGKTSYGTKDVRHGCQSTGKGGCL